jgi:demethylmenaquinone methyltransferase/2-methoxy-6-polyprenyl-1,4-benzoquinol methylase
MDHTIVASRPTSVEPGVRRTPSIDSMMQATQQQHTDAPAWRDEELARDPHAHTEKHDKVRRMFASIAHAYDINNRVHSFGRDQAWRRTAVRAAAVQQSDDVLDVACGTGDLTRAFADAGARSVTGLDFTEEMLAIARTKPLDVRGGDTPITYLNGDAQALPFDDASFDIVSIAFGIRNVADPAQALREFRRVLRPGGRLVVLEFGRPSPAPVRWVNDLYCNVIMPRTASLISRDRSGAYRYLPRSITTFYDRERMEAAITEAGFTEVSSKRLTFGVCLCSRGIVR